MNELTLNQSELVVLENVLDSYITQKTSVALSTILGESITHSVKKTHSEISKIRSERNSEELILCSVFLYGAGDIRLGILYSISEDDAKKIAAKLMCMDKIDVLDEIGKSAISEVGNIMSGSFFNALANHTGLKVDLSTPDFAMTSIACILDPHASEFLCPTNDLITEIELTSESSAIKIHMLVIQDHENAKKLMKDGCQINAN